MCFWSDGLLDSFGKLSVEFVSEIIIIEGNLGMIPRMRISHKFDYLGNGRLSLPSACTSRRESKDTSFERDNIDGRTNEKDAGQQNFPISTKTTGCEGGN